MGMRLSILMLAAEAAATKAKVTIKNFMVAHMAILK